MDPNSHDGRAAFRSKTFFSADGSLAAGGEPMQRIPSRPARMPSAVQTPDIPLSTHEQSWRGATSAATHEAHAKLSEASSRGWIHSVGHWETNDAKFDTGEEGEGRGVYPLGQTGVVYSGRDARIEAGAEGRLAREALIARDAAQEGHGNLSTRFIMHRFFTKVDTDDVAGLIDECFERWDTDNNGALDRQELAVAFSEMAGRNVTSVTRRDVQELMDIFDTDINGSIDADELKHMVFLSIGIAEASCPCSVCATAQKHKTGGILQFFDLDDEESAPSDDSSDADLDDDAKLRRRVLREHRDVERLLISETERRQRRFGGFTEVHPKPEREEVTERFEAGGGVGELCGDTWTLNGIEDVREVEVTVDNQNLVVQGCQGGGGGPCAMRAVGAIKELSVVDCTNLILLIDAVKEQARFLDCESVTVMICGRVPTPISFKNIRGFHLRAHRANVHCSISLSNAHEVEIRRTLHGNLDPPREVLAHTALRSVRGLARQHVLLEPLDLLNSAVARMEVTLLPSDGVFVMQEGIITKSADPSSGMVKGEARLFLEVPGEEDASLPGPGAQSPQSPLAADSPIREAGFHVTKKVGHLGHTHATSLALAHH